MPLTYQQEPGPTRGALGPAVTLPGGVPGSGVPGPGAVPGPFQGRKRAILPGTDGEPDRAVLLEWFTGEEAAARARRRVGIAHVHLLPLLRVEVEADGRLCAVSELPRGADLWTVARAAALLPGPDGAGLPAWWVVAVLLQVGRGLQALYDRLGRRVWEAHGALHPANVFVSEEGEVRLLSFSALGGPGSGAPEAALGARLCGPAADVWALGKMMGDLLPDLLRDGGRIPPLSRLLAAMQAPWPSGWADRRPPLAEVLSGLEAYLIEAGPLELREGLGEVLRRVCPQGVSAAGELSELDVLGAWEDLWGDPGTGAEPERAPGPIQARAQTQAQGGDGRPGRAGSTAGGAPATLALLGLGGGLLLLAIIYVLRALGVW